MNQWLLSAALFTVLISTNSFACPDNQHSECVIPRFPFGGCAQSICVPDAIPSSEDLAGVIITPSAASIPSAADAAKSMGDNIISKIALEAAGNPSVKDAARGWEVATCGVVGYFAVKAVTAGYSVPICLAAGAATTAAGVFVASSCAAFVEGAGAAITVSTCAILCARGEISGCDEDQKSGNEDSEHPQCATLYSDRDFGSHAIDIPKGAQIDWLPSLRISDSETWNDRVSSLRVSPGCHLTLYENGGFAGFRDDFFSQEIDLTANNDSYSSLKCDCY